MQKELDALPTKVSIRLLGVNEVGHESGNASFTTGRVLPWLQDTAADGVWASWQVAFRDVVVLDTSGHRVAVFNLTANDLSQPASYDALKNLLVGVASAE
jgi:hypothetical protein